MCNMYRNLKIGRFLRIYIRPSGTVEKTEVGEEVQQEGGESETQETLWTQKTCHQHLICIHVEKKSKWGKSKQRSREQLHRTAEMLENTHDWWAAWQTLAATFRDEF